MPSATPNRFANTQKRTTESLTLDSCLRVSSYLLFTRLSFGMQEGRMTTGYFHVSSCITFCTKMASEQYVPGQNSNRLEIETYLQMWTRKRPSSFGRLAELGFPPCSSSKRVACQQQMNVTDKICSDCCVYTHTHHPNHLFPLMGSLGSSVPTRARSSLAGNVSITTGEGSCILVQLYLVCIVAFLQFLFFMW